MILPAKLRMDTEYMSRATFLSDLKLLVDTVMRRWDISAMCALLNVDAAKVNSRPIEFNSTAAKVSATRFVAIPQDESLV